MPPVLLEPDIDDVQNSILSHAQPGAGSTWQATNYGSLWYWAPDDFVTWNLVVNEMEHC